MNLTFTRLAKALKRPSFFSSIHLTILATLFVSLLGCGSTEKESKVKRPRLSDGSYANLISEFTQKDEKYSGLHNLYHVKVTILNSKVNGARNDRIRYFNQYSPKKANELREKTFQEMSNFSQFFVGYYSPKKDIRQLQSNWNFYLEHNGVKYEGKIKKLSMKKFEAQFLYPHMDGFSKPYLIQFEVPMSQLEQHSSQLIMTGPPGKSTFKFSPGES